MKDQTKKIFIGLACGIAIVAALLLVVVKKAPHSQTYTVKSGTRFVMGTTAQIVVDDANEQVAYECIEAAFEEITRIESLMSSHDPNSQLSMVNRRAYGKPVKISEDLFFVLEKAVSYGQLTDGAFDVTLGPAIDLWSQAAEQGQVPSQEEIDFTKSRVGYEKLMLDKENKTIEFATNGMRIDLGGIAKGYAIDKAIETIINKGAYGALVDIGGDIRCFRTEAEKTDWNIGLQDPDINKSSGDGVLMTLKIRNKAVTTSGDYQRYVEIDGKRYSHIYDRSTGSSSDELSSVTIITEAAIDADALATAVSVMGKDAGLKLIKKIKDVEAIIYTAGPEYKMFKTKKASDYIAK